MAIHCADATDLDAVFRSRGVPCTPQRRAVWRFFSARPQGHTIAEAVEALQGEGIGQATVYRTVFLLLDLGLLTRVQDPTGKAYFVAIHTDHAHPLICRGCRRIVEFDTCGLSMLEKLLVAQTGYTIESHRLEVYGLCPQCQAGTQP